MNLMVNYYRIILSVFPRVGYLFSLGMGVCLLVLSVPFNVSAIVRNPSDTQIHDALERGKESARNHQTPNTLYWHFGSTDSVLPHGFLMTKLSGMAVMSSHFALRGEQPDDQAIRRVVAEEALQVVMTVFGNSPRFAVDSYLLLKQGNRVIKPHWIRFDALAKKHRIEGKGLIFQGKIVGAFVYDSFDPTMRTSLLVFPGEGGELSFDLDFSAIP